MLKLCLTCNKEHTQNFFPKTGKGFISNKCKDCTSEYKRLHNEKVNPFIESVCLLCENKYSHRLKTKANTCKNCRSSVVASRKDNFSICLVCNKNIKAKTDRTKYCNAECFNKRASKKQEYKAWYAKNKEKRKIYHRDKYNNDVNFRLADCLRSRLRKAISYNKAGSAVRDLGCSISELRSYLESKFTDGMSWSNHGEWHIDHISPLSKYNLSDPVQFKIACHYSNLQPLWAKDNLIKSNY